MATYIRGTDCNGCPGCTNDPCDPAPAAPAPTLVCDSISASLTKCGYTEWSGYESTPPKRYLVLTLSGTLTAETNAETDCSGACDSKITYAYSGTCSYSRPACAETTSGNQQTTVYSDCVNGGTPTDFATCDLETPFTGFTDSYTATVHSQSGDGCLSGFDYTGSASATLSSEYTTALLISDTEAALPSYPDTWAGTCSSYRDLDSDELTYTIRRFKYKFELPDLTGFSCYKITWLEGATAKEYIWNGTDTETPVYGPISEPGTNGTIGISSIVATCECA